MEQEARRSERGALKFAKCAKRWQLASEQVQRSSAQALASPPRRGLVATQETIELIAHRR
jgi:hypothetical protein